MTVKQLFERDKCDTVYEGDILYCRSGYKEREVTWIRLGNNELIIDVDL